MKTYAGIGSRTITGEERQKIHIIAKKLAVAGFIVYSGNAEGSDIAFQEGSEGNCVLLLPWKGFNKKVYDVNKSIAQFEVGKSDDGQATIEKYHPNPKSLSYGGRLMMARNWHQITGWEMYPRVQFVVCCANRDERGKILGGTGQACRIAEDFSLPIFNIRDMDWMDRFNLFVSGII